MQTLIRTIQITFIAVVMAACFAGFAADCQGWRECGKWPGDIAADADIAHMSRSQP